MVVHENCRDVGDAVRQRDAEMEKYKKKPYSE